MTTVHHGMHLVNSDCMHACVYVCVHHKIHRMFLQVGRQPSLLRNCEGFWNRRKFSLSIGQMFLPSPSHHSCFVFWSFSQDHTLVEREQLLHCVQSFNTNCTEGSRCSCASAQSSGFSLFLIWLVTNIFCTTLAKLVLILQSKRCPLCIQHTPYKFLVPDGFLGSWNSI